MKLYASGRGRTDEVRLLTHEQIICPPSHRTFEILLNVINFDLKNKNTIISRWMYFNLLNPFHVVETIENDDVR